jgi:hypothetical protein
MPEQGVRFVHGLQEDLLGISDMLTKIKQQKIIWVCHSLGGIVVKTVSLLTVDLGQVRVYHLHSPADYIPRLLFRLI